MNRGGITALGLALGLVALFGVGRVLAFETAVDHADHDHQFVRISSSRPTWGPAEFDIPPLIGRESENAV